MFYDLQTDTNLLTFGKLNLHIMKVIEFASLLIPVAIASALYAFMRYKYPDGTLRPWIYSLVLGFIFGFLALGVIYVAGLLGFDQPKSLKRTTFLSFVVLGGAQEFLKFLILRFYALPLKIFRGSADGIVYSIAISMGMSVVVLVYYILSPLLRSFEFYPVMLGTLGIAATLSAIIMGFFVGMGKARNNRFVDSMTGLLGAAFLNGLYYFCFFTHEYLLAALAGAATLGIALFFIVLVLRQQES